jgi:DNA (cytosine-5)-methyltransferase 1
VSTKHKFTSAGLFCGIGGLCQGFEKAGFANLWANDFDDEVAQTYAYNYPDSEFLHSDIAELDFDKLPAVDVLHGGFPCQSFSQAGNRKGFEDERGQLFLTMMDKITAMANKPKVLVFENSPYIKIGGKGSWFSQVVFKIRKAGYHFSSANSFEIDARENGGSPQSRVRLFMVAYLKDLGSFNPFHDLKFKNSIIDLEDLLDREKIDDPYYFLDPENKYSRMILKYASTINDLRIFQLRKTVVRVQDPGMCPTLTANMGAGGHNVPFILDQGAVRKLTERECLRLQSFPEEFSFPENISKTARYRMIGNAVNASVSFGIAQYIFEKLSEIENESVMGIPA